MLKQKMIYANTHQLSPLSIILAQRCIFEIYNISGPVCCTTKQAPLPVLKSYTCLKVIFMCLQCKTLTYLQFINMKIIWNKGNQYIRIYNKQWTHYSSLNALTIFAIDKNGDFIQFRRNQNWQNV